VIRPAIVESAGPSSARYHDGEVRFLKERITQRDESLRRQLAALSTQPAVAVHGSLPLSGWARRTDTGSPEFRREKTAEGGDALCLAVKGNTICSWRTKAMLEEGAYRFEGRIRTKDVRASPGEPTGGAGLRISGGAVSVELTGTQDWQRFAYSFRVPEGGGQIEAICELRAARGEAWFDTASLRVVRLR